MCNLIRIEFKKAFTNKLFISALAIGTVISVLCAIYNIQAMELEKQYYQRALEATEYISGCYGQCCLKQR